MFNDIKIGPITIHMYGVMIAIGFFMALIMTLRRGKKRDFDEDIIFGIFFCAVIGGPLGARLLYYIVELPAIIQNPSILWNFKNGYVVYGGIIGGILCSLIYCKIKKTAFIPYFDLAIPSVALAQGFGRLGCQFAGCCYGQETDGWCSVTFQNSNYAPNGIKLLPTQLVSSAGDFLICGILLLYAKKKPQNGRVAALYLLLYGIGRFIIEFFRNDYRGSVGPFSTSQIISFGIVAAGIVMYIAAPKIANQKV